MEVELRAKVKNRHELRMNLKRIGAKLIKTEHLTDYYFGSIQLYRLVGHSFWIRLRESKGHVELAYKGPTAMDGVYEELEQQLQDLDVSLNILKKIGLENPITIKKQRETYRRRGLTIVIDTIENKGIYLEIEMISNNPDKSALFSVMKELGIKDADIFEKGFITLFLQEINSPYCKWIVN